MFTLEYLKKTSIKHEYFYQLDVQVPVLGGKHKCQIYDKKLSEKHQKCLNMLDEIGMKQLNVIKGFLYVHYWQCVSVTDWPFIKNKKNPFNVKNQDDAYAKSKLDCILLDHVTNYKRDFLALSFTPKWEEEHGICVLIRNGMVIGHCDSQDTYAKFDP